MKYLTKEIEEVSKLEPCNRYKYFLKRVADFEKIYSLKFDNNAWALSEVEGNKLISLWPGKEFAFLCAKDAWINCWVEEIDLNVFQKLLYPEWNSKSYLVNIFSVIDKIGFVVSFEDLIRDLDDELRKYE
jgi:hypothetical protein